MTNTIRSIMKERLRKTYNKMLHSLTSYLSTRMNKQKDTSSGIWWRNNGKDT